MALSLDELREEVLALPVDKRLGLAESIYESLDDPEMRFELHPDWLPELKRRSEEFHSGKVKGIPWEEVQAELDSLT